MIVKLYKSILFIVLSLCASAGLAQISSESIPNSISHEDEFKWSPCGDLECMYEYYEVTVFNRWGSKVFHSEDPKEYWDVKKVQAGKYYYVVAYGSAKEGSESNSGHVTVLK